MPDINDIWDDEEDFKMTYPDAITQKFLQMKDRKLKKSEEVDVVNLKDIITDFEIEVIHANAQFGDQCKRDVVNEAIMQAACHLHNGHTAQMIITEHGLVEHSTSSRPPLTDKGRKYINALCKSILEN